jgi:hypothetical protein
MAVHSLGFNPKVNRWIVASAVKANPACFARYLNVAAYELKLLPFM